MTSLGHDFAVQAASLQEKMETYEPVPSHIGKMQYIRPEYMYSVPSHSPLSDRYLQVLSNHKTSKPEISSSGEALCKFSPGKIRALHTVCQQQELIGTLLDVLNETSPPNSQPSITPFESLERSTIDSLFESEINKGKYVILRIIEPAISESCIQTVVEDHVGFVCWLTVYHYSVLEESSFDVGQFLIVKEPYFVRYETGIDLITTECPTDIILLDPSHDLYHLTQEIQWRNQISQSEDENETETVTTTADWIEKGAEFLSRQQYTKARTAAIMALRKSEKKSQGWMECCNFLAYIHARFQNYEKAQDLIDEARKEAPDNPELLLTAAELARCQSNFNLTGTLYLKLVEMEVECKGVSRSYFEAKDEEMRYRMLEENEGIYSPEYFKEMNTGDLLNGKIECAEYLGPVDIVNISGKGRGLIVAKNVPAETLLIVSKAIVCCERLSEDLNLSFKYAAQKLLPYMVDTFVKNPRKWFEKIRELQGNCLGPVKNFQLYCDPEKETEPICNTRLLRKVLFYNLMFIRDDEKDKESAEKSLSNVRGWGLFYAPSFMNHSCCPNTLSVFVNDVVFIFARQDLKKGQEITTDYLPANFPRDKVRKFLQPRRFECNCKLCQPQPTSLVSNSFLKRFGELFT